MAYKSATRFAVAHPRTASLIDIVATWTALARQRRDLAGLDPHLLNDVGLAQTEAEAEAKRPFWDVPSHWRL